MQAAAAKLAKRGSRHFNRSGSSKAGSDNESESNAGGAGGAAAGRGAVPSMTAVSSTSAGGAMGEVDGLGTNTASSNAMTPEDSLRAYELFEMLRTFEPGQSDTEALYRAIDASGGAGGNKGTSSSRGPSLPTPLHTAIRCAKTDTVGIVMQRRPQDINARDPEGSTPLHLASQLGRTEIVMLLMSQSNIDDTVRNAQGRTALEVAKGSETARVLQVARAQYSETYASLLAAYVNSPGGATDGTMTPRTAQKNLALPSHMSPNMSDNASLNGADGSDARDALANLLKKERSKNIDFSALTPGPKGTTVIHEAARRRDVDMLKLCAARGASMVVRDRRGKMPLDVAKDDTIRSLLRQGATSEGRALRNSTSLASGVSLAAGTMSVSPVLGGQTPSAITGQSGRAPPPEMKGYLSKWTNMARGYRTRWFVLHHGHISYYRDAEEEGQASRGTISTAIAVVEHSGSSSASGGSGDKSSFTIGTSLGKSPKWYLKGNHPVETMQWVQALRASIEYMRSADAGITAMGNSPNLGLGVSSLSGGTSVGRSASAGTSTSSLIPPGGAPASVASGSTAAVALATPGFPALNRMNTSRTAKSMMSDFDNPNTRSPSPQLTEGSIYGDDNDPNTPPHQDNFDLLANSAKTQLNVTEQLLNSLAAYDTDAAKRQEVVTAARSSLSMISALFDQHIEQVTEREKWYIRRYEREVSAKKMWEENMRSVVSGQAELEQQLQDSQRLNSKRKRALKDLKQSVLAEVSLDGTGSPSTAAAGGAAIPVTPARGTAAIDTAFEEASNEILAPSANRARAASDLASPIASTRLAADLQAVDSIISDSSDDEDDFYDAVESGAVPLQSPGPIAATEKVTEWPKRIQEEIGEDPEKFLEIKSFEGYKHLRDRLPISSDDRPPVSLWAILKGSIGKDLTKISFPVYFNEPTSMLQRMAEDMEYSECLDAAAAERDSLKRIAYVTGFAMSNYASTIGRIAKPFNPMLSETFELANLDKKYRYISEQVSHHPPISACIAESPYWNYYGEVDAKSKFLGKSFEIRPTGVAHADLVIPEDWAPAYPAARLRKGYVREHYSWKKVTTSVSGFVMGAPQIDHYGDMEVTNHRTGEKCILTFKPKGWRGKDSCEVKGSVFDKSGNLAWELAGRWNGQLVARRAGAGGGVLQPDEKLPAKSSPEYLLIWKINQQPPNMPFNLTRFALTLNDARPEIKAYLPPTDCRLRPDQHAFEEGQFERANELKSALEAFQRGTRTQREKGELPPHQPRWFTHTTEEDSGQSVWEPKRLEDGSLEYWKERNVAYKAVIDGQEPHWHGVDRIFGVTI